MIRKRKEIKFESVIKLTFRLHFSLHVRKQLISAEFDPCKMTYRKGYCEHVTLAVHSKDISISMELRTETSCRIIQTGWIRATTKSDLGPQ